MNTKQARVISPQLIKAYRQARYVVELPGNLITLRIGQVNSDLTKFMADEGVTAAAFLTAFNPYSEELSESDNEAGSK